MIIYHDELVSINIEGHGIINFNHARLIEYKSSSGVKSWEIVIEGANAILTGLLLDSNSNYQLNLVGKNGIKYIGKAIIVRDNNFLGSGELKREK